MQSPTISLRSHSPAVITCYFEYKKKITIERWRDKATGSPKRKSGGLRFRRTRARKREPKYESESRASNLWRARSLKIIERHKSPGVGTTSSRPKFLASFAPRGAQTQCSRLLKRRRRNGDERLREKRWEEKKKRRSTLGRTHPRIRYRNGEFTARNSRRGLHVIVGSARETR